jgi:hypothetical protein
MTDIDKSAEVAAHNMIERYRDKALEEINQRIIELESRNQPEAVRLWRKIRKRVEVLQGISRGRTRH